MVAAKLEALTIMVKGLQHQLHLLSSALAQQSGLGLQPEQDVPQVLRPTPCTAKHIQASFQGDNPVGQGEQALLHSGDLPAVLLVPVARAAVTVGDPGHKGDAQVAPGS